MTITVYKSTDSSAPVLSGQVGALVALLDACLVNGYGSKSALGWGKPYSGTNAGVYRAPSGTRHYLQVTDNAISSGGAHEAQAWGYETMTGNAVGSGVFPTAAQSASGICWNKSTLSNSTARDWTLIGDDKTFYLTMNAGATVPTTGAFGFGEFESYKASDAYNTFIGGSTSFNSNTPVWGLMAAQAYGTATGQTGFYLARSFSQLGTALNAYVTGPMANTATLGISGITYPNGPDGGLHVGSVFVCEPTAGTPIRGRLRGYFAPIHNQPLTQYDTATNVTGLSGLTLIALAVGTNNANGQILIDTTGPW